MNYDSIYGSTLFILMAVILWRIFKMVKRLLNHLSDRKEKD